MSSMNDPRGGAGDGSVFDAVDALLASDPATCGPDELASLVRLAWRVRRWLDAFEAAIAAQATRLAGEGGSADAATVARWWRAAQPSRCRGRRGPGCGL
jgi:hypothetical protein